MGLFITLEGPEGSGKTTHAQLLANWLTELGYDVLTTREPGGTRIGDVVRTLLLDPIYAGIRPETEFLLFSAARAQIVGEIIRPHLAEDGIVICDRFADSSLAYQGYGRRLDQDTVRTITAFATGSLLPDLTLFLDLPVVEGFRRKQTGGQGKPDRLEQERQEFHERVRQGYLTLARAEPARWAILDAGRPIEDVQKEIRSRVSERLATREGASRAPAQVRGNTVQEPSLSSEERSDDE
jgi:dTMP kinase